jgi:hypothetical protein
MRDCLDSGWSDLNVTFSLQVFELVWEQSIDSYFRFIDFIYEPCPVSSDKGQLLDPRC